MDLFEGSVCYSTFGEISPTKDVPVQVCFLCEATKGADGDMNMCYTNLSESAQYWGTLYRSNPWAITPSYCALVGFHISMIVPDLLHVWNLGVLQQLLGSALRVILTDQIVFTQGDLESRLKAATISLRAFAKQSRLPLRWRKLNKGRLHWKSRSYPSLGGSGYDAFVISRWLHSTLQPFTAVYPEIATLLWTSNQAISLLYDAHFFLTPQEQDTVRTLGSLFLRTYLSLASQALGRGQYLWRVIPKFHLLAHVFRCDRVCNVAKHSTWMDEDYLKKVGKTLRLRPKPTIQHRCLQRWMLSIPGHLERCRQKHNR